MAPALSPKPIPNPGPGGSQAGSVTCSPPGPGPAPRRPRIRAECEFGPRPCPWVGCRWHLAWEVGRIASLLRRGDAWEVAGAVMGLPVSCVLDMAEEPSTTGEIAHALGVTHQRVSQIERAAMRKLMSGPLKGLEELLH